MSNTTEQQADLVLDKPRSRDDLIKAPEWALIPKEGLSIKLEVKNYLFFCQCTVRVHYVVPYFLYWSCNILILILN